MNTWLDNPQHNQNTATYCKENRTTDDRDHNVEDTKLPLVLCGFKTKTDLASEREAVTLTVYSWPAQAEYKEMI